MLTFHFKTPDVAEAALFQAPDAWNLRERALRSLNENDKHDVSSKISNCTRFRNGRREAVCGSLWCVPCREAATLAAYNRVDKHIKKREYANHNLQHITGVVGLCNFNVGSLEQILNQDRLRWRRIRRRFSQSGKLEDGGANNHSSGTPEEIHHSFWLELVYEFELVNWQFLKGSTKDEYKQKQIEHLKTAFPDVGEKFLFVHFHGITSLNYEQLKEACGDEYYHSGSKLVKTNDAGLFTQNLHANKPLQKNIEKMTSYPLKNPYGYKHSFKGNDHDTVEKFSSKELADLIVLYDDIQGRGWRSLFRSAAFN